MVSSLDELGELLEENNLTPTDITFIVNFMKTENISPQLAMRRIKAFESLKQKMEENSDKDAINQLEQELQQVKNQLLQKTEELNQLQTQKTGLESEKQELETKSELLDSEREELQRQLELLRDIQLEDDSDDIAEIEKVKEIISILDVINGKYDRISDLLSPISKWLQTIAEDQDLEIDQEEYIALVNNFLRETSSGTSKIVPPADEASVAPIQKSQTSESHEKTTIKVEKPQPSKPEKKVSAKEEQVIDLFLDFIEEADSDKGFKDRVSTICDMDEAYEYLGSIGLSQVYSFASRGIKKKEELKQLLESWKKEGVPR